MKNFVGFTLGCLFAFLSSGITPLMAQDAAVNELVITGTVKNKDSRKKHQKRYHQNILNKYKIVYSHHL